MGNRKERCETCKFMNAWEEASKPTYMDTGTPVDALGDCRRYAPRPLEKEPRARWPWVKAQDWCGEWEPKPAATKEEPKKKSWFDPVKIS